MISARGWRLLGAAGCAVAALTLAGCGDNGPSGDTDQPAYDGPIAEFMGWETTGSEPERAFTEQERQQHHQVQDLIVTCMSEAGFEYTPEPFYGDRETDVQDPNEQVWRLRQADPEAFAREYGYGFTTLDYRREAVATPDPADDPNWTYRESLSPAAQEEYDKALWGDWDAYEEQREAAGEDGGVPATEPSGCSGQAYQEVYGDRGEADRDQFADLFEQWDALHQRIQDDPRMDEARQAWSGCMADAGYPGLADLYDGQNEVSERQSELYGWGREANSPGAVASPAPVETVEPDPAELAELRQFERDIALADYTCRQDHDIDGIERSVRYEHEERFIEDNRERLEAYRDWSDQQGYGE